MNVEYERTRLDALVPGDTVYVRTGRSGGFGFVDSNFRVRWRDKGVPNGYGYGTTTDSDGTDSITEVYKVKGLVPPPWPKRKYDYAEAVTEIPTTVRLKDSSSYRAVEEVSHCRVSGDYSVRVEGLGRFYSDDFFNNFVDINDNQIGADQ